LSSPAPLPHPFRPPLHTSCRPTPWRLRPCPASTSHLPPPTSHFHTLTHYFHHNRLRVTPSRPDQLQPGDRPDAEISRPIPGNGRGTGQHGGVKRGSSTPGALQKNNCAKRARADSRLRRSPLSNQQYQLETSTPRETTFLRTSNPRASEACAFCIPHHINLTDGT